MVNSIEIKDVKYFLANLMVVFIVFMVPIAFAYGLKKQVDIYGFSPIEESGDVLIKHIKEHFWVFSILNIAEDFPYYKITPNVDSVSHAVEYLSLDGEIVAYITFDSLSCLVNDTYSAEELFGIGDDVDWTDCEYVKNFGFAQITTDEYKPKINITIGGLGFIIILFAFFVTWNSLILLAVGSLKAVKSIVNRVFDWILTTKY
ncbi:MAG: hypothetical protein H6779_04195 [Candidatus Nomurabacteria bacterium]|nr:MAG: hypothetical protein H6779_04195 [Candidatus Nomurabacteria bacterium]